MAAIITNKFRIHNQEQFVESFSEASPNVYYLGIGRPQAFTTSTRGKWKRIYSKWKRNVSQKSRCELNECVWELSWWNT